MKKDGQTRNTLVLTGAGGFLGRNLLSLFLNRGMFVIAVTSRSYSDIRRMAELDVQNDNLCIVSHDDRAEITKDLSGADIIINAGFPRNNDGKSLSQGMEFIGWLFQEALRRGAKAVMNVSSQSVYDQHRAEPATEKTPVCPETPYAVAKYATELMLNGLCTGIPHTNIRLASLVGPGFNQRVVNKMVERALREGQVIATDQTGVFGYLDVLDAARGIAGLVDAGPSCWQEIINVGTKHGVTTEVIAGHIKDELLRRGRVVKVCCQNSNNSTLNTTLNSDVLHELTGWSPVERLPETIGRIADSFSANTLL